MCSEVLDTLEIALSQSETLLHCHHVRIYGILNTDSSQLDFVVYYRERQCSITGQAPQEWPESKDKQLGELETILYFTTYPLSQNGWSFQKFTSCYLHIGKLSRLYNEVTLLHLGKFSWVFYHLGSDLIKEESSAKLP